MFTKIPVYLIITFYYSTFALTVLIMKIFNLFLFNAPHNIIRIEVKNNLDHNYFDLMTCIDLNYNIIDYFDYIYMKSTLAKQIDTKNMFFL